jgi:hypothetical protein
VTSLLACVRMYFVHWCISLALSGQRSRTSPRVPEGHMCCGSDSSNSWQATIQGKTKTCRLLHKSSGGTRMVLICMLLHIIPRREPAWYDKTWSTHGILHAITFAGLSATSASSHAPGFVPGRQSHLPRCCQYFHLHPTCGVKIKCK